MPELPEVEIIRRGLLSICVGNVINKVDVFHQRVERYSPGELARLHSQRITAVARRGKFLWFMLESTNHTDSQLSPEAIVAHLGMSGQFRVDSPRSPHLRAVFELADGRELEFVDQRTFGFLRPDRLIPTADGEAGGEGTNSPLMPSSLSHIARDILDPYCDEDTLCHRILTLRCAIKTALLNQTLVSGIGNIYADEGLFLARIHPATPAGRIGMAAAHRLIESVRHVMYAALQAGGTSFDALYVRVNGESGYFDRSLQVYGRGGQACKRCGATLNKISISGRSSVFCPQCQARPDK